jgi:hypothetical protein
MIGEHTLAVTAGLGGTTIGSRAPGRGTMSSSDELLQCFGIYVCLYVQAHRSVLGHSVCRRGL